MLTKTKEYENWWRYKDMPFFSQDINDYFGFVYCITNTISEHFYIGYKYFYHKKSYQRSNKKTKILKESDWKYYYGSSIPFNNFVMCCSEDYFNRDILKLCHTREELLYQEAKYQFKYDVLNNELSFNNNIAGTFYPYS